MTHESLTNADWDWTVERMGGVSLITTLARENQGIPAGAGDWQRD